MIVSFEMSVCPSTCKSGGQPFTCSKDGNRERKAGSVSYGRGGGGNPFSFHLDLSLFFVDAGLLDVGPDLSSLVFFQNGLNALHLAAKEGHVDLVQELLDRGAAVDSATKVGYLSFPLSKYQLLKRRTWKLLV